MRPEAELPSSKSGELLGRGRQLLGVRGRRHRVLVVQPSAASWNDVIIDRIGLPYWIACTRRVEKEWPSRIRSTAKRIGWLASPGRRK